MNAHGKRLALLVVVILLPPFLQHAPSIYAAGPETTYARRANTVVRDVIAATRRSFRFQVPLAVVSPAELRSVAADDFALTWPGYSGDAKLRKEVYASVRTLAVRYSLVHKKLYVCEETLVARLRQNAPDDPNLRDCVIDLLLANELTRALDDQHFSLADQFRRSRRSQPASCLRALMEGHGAYVINQIALQHEWPLEARCLAGNWCSGWLPEGGPSEYALINASDPLRQTGQRLLGLLYQSEGPSTIDRLFLKPPEQVDELLNMPIYLGRIRALRPDPAGLEAVLRQCPGWLGLDGWQIRICTPHEMMDRFRLPIGTIDSEPAQLRAGQGLVLTRNPSTGTLSILLVHYHDRVPLTLEVLLQCANTFLLDTASGLGAVYEEGDTSLFIGADTQTVVRQGHFSSNGRALFAATTAAGIMGNSALIVAGYGLPVEKRLLTQVVNDALDRIEQSRHN